LCANAGAKGGVPSGQKAAGKGKQRAYTRPQKIVLTKERGGGAQKRVWWSRVRASSAGGARLIGGAGLGKNGNALEEREQTRGGVAQDDGKRARLGGRVEGGFKGCRLKGRRRGWLGTQAGCRGRVQLHSPG